MRVLLCLAAWMMSVTMVLAQSSNQRPAVKDGSLGSALTDERARFAQCLKDWDVTTHMTRQEWEQTCRRVTNERVKYLREQRN